MSTNANFHLKLGGIAGESISSLFINVRDFDQLSMEVKPAFNNLSPSLALVVITISLRSFLLLCFSLFLIISEKSVSDKQAGEAPDQQTGGDHQPPPAGDHHPRRQSGGLHVDSRGCDYYSPLSGQCWCPAASSVHCLVHTEPDVL